MVCVLIVGSLDVPLGSPHRLCSGSSAVLSGSQLNFGTYYRTLLAAIDSAQQASENTLYCQAQQGPQTGVCLSRADIKEERNYKVHSLVCTAVQHMRTAQSCCIFQTV